MSAGAAAPSLVAEGISARYSDATGEPIEALRSVTVHIQPGTMVAVMGPSGSGKTTLIHALCGIVPVTAGEIRFGGTVISGMSEARRDAWRHATCGMIFQDFRLIEELDTVANVMLPATFSRMRAGDEVKTRARALLERFEVPQRAGSVSHLSRGQRQRVALARALVMDPPIILADEPTASLDPENGDRIGREFEDLAKAGKTIVCITHDERLAAYATSVLRLNDGRVAA